ncbi:MAG: metallophosphoesterase [Rectinemataceae bacterium]
MKHRPDTVKILCVADEVDLLVYSPRIRERFGDVDLVLSAGDLPDEYLGYITSMLNRPIVSVAGNHDSGPGLSAAARVSNFNALEIHDSRAMTGRIAFKVKKESGLRILGIPGSMRYNSGPNQFSQFSMSWRIALMLPGLLVRRLFTGRGVDIVLAHAPPSGIHDGPDLPHRGFSSFRWLIRAAAPAYFVHGHVHLYDLQTARETQMGSTTVINVYGHKVIETGGRS